MALDLKKQARKRKTPPKLHVRKGDLVLVLAGKDKGKQGRVIEARPKEQRVIVEGVNIVKRHQKPRPALGTIGAIQGGIIEKPAPIHVSNVMVICPACNRPTRVGKKETPDGRRVRVCKKCGEELVARA